MRRNKLSLGRASATLLRRRTFSTSHCQLRWQHKRGIMSGGGGPSQCAAIGSKIDTNCCQYDVIGRVDGDWLLRFKLCFLNRRTCFKMFRQVLPSMPNQMQLVLLWRHSFTFLTLEKNWLTCKCASHTLHLATLWHDQTKIAWSFAYYWHLKTYI